MVTWYDEIQRDLTLRTDYSIELALFHTVCLWADAMHSSPWHYLSRYKLSVKLSKIISIRLSMYGKTSGNKSAFFCNMHHCLSRMNSLVLYCWSRCGDDCVSNGLNLLYCHYNMVLMPHTYIRTSLIWYSNGIPYVCVQCIKNMSSSSSTRTNTRGSCLYIPSNYMIHKIMLPNLLSS